MNRKTEHSSAASTSTQALPASFRGDVVVVTLGVVALAGIGVLLLRGGQMSLGSTGLTLEVLAHT